MTCDNCGHPIDRDTAEKGRCRQCGAIPAYVLKAAEKAELVRRIVEQGGSVRILDDRIEAERRPPAIDERPAPLDRSSGGLAIVGWLMFLSVGFGAVTIATLAFHQTSTRPALVEPPRQTPIAAPPEVTKPTAPISADPPALAATPTTTSTPAPRRNQQPSTSVDAVIAAHRPAFAQCQRIEVAREPAAPRRYSLAITVGPTGKAEWFEVLSQVSGTMKTCLEAVVRGLEFAKPSAGSTRSIVTLSLPST